MRTPILAVLVLVALSAMLHAQTTSVTTDAVEDAMTSSANPDMALGTSFSCSPGTPAYNVLGIGYNWNTSSGTFCPLYQGVAMSYVKWTLPSLPSGAVITTATLNMHGAGGISPGDGVAFTIRIARVTQTWSESSITWNNSPSSASYEANFEVDQDGNYPSEIDITSIVEYWYENSGSNEGIVLFVPSPSFSGANIKYWGAHENTIGKRAPRLTVNYSTSYQLELTAPSSSQTVQQGDEVYITWTGSGPSGSTVNLRRDDDNTWDNSSAGEAWIALSQSVSGYHYWNTSSTPVGTYYVAGLLTDGSGSVYDYAEGMVTIKEPLSIAVTAPASDLEVSIGDEVTISWTGDGPAGSAVSIRRDDDNTWNNGSPGETWIAIDQAPSDSYPWNTSTTPAGTYYIAAFITDGVDSEYDYGTGRVTINEPLSIEVTSPASQDSVRKGESTSIVWTGTGPAGVTVSLRRDDDNTWNNSSPGESWIALSQSASDEYSWNTGDTPPGTYYIAAMITDGSSSEWDYAPGTVTVLPTPGVTILIHGFQLLGGLPYLASSAVEYWGEDFVCSILDRFGGGRVFVYQPESGWLAPNPDNIEAFQNRDDPDGETIILHDWREFSNDAESGQAEAAADALFASLIAPAGDGVVDPIYVNTNLGTATKPIHIIGHSRGAVVASELCQRLSALGIPVSYMTYLDVHDWDENDDSSPGGATGVPFDESFHDPAVQVWNNINYADTYWQNASSDIVPSGRSLSSFLSSTEINLTSRDGFGNDDSESLDSNAHARTVHWYKGTIEPGVHFMLSDWYEGGNGEGFGFDKWIDLGAYDYDGSGNGISIPADAISFMNILPYPSDNDGDLDSSDITFFNGDFSLTDLGASIAGWSAHGGGGSGHVENHHLELDLNDKYRTHNRFYVPSNAQKLTFWYKVQIASDGFGEDTDRLVVSLLSASGQVIYQKTVAYLNTTNSGILDSLSLVDHQNSIRLLRFEIVPSGFTDSEVWIDDVTIDTTENPLAVELVRFEATIVGENVNLRWTTITETDNAGFEIQRSADGIAWEVIAFIPGTGTSTSSLEYSYADIAVGPGEYYYRILQKDRNGTSSLSSILGPIVVAPTRFELSQNFPNPFNPSTTIEFDLPVESTVRLSIVNLLGQEVAVLASGSHPAGRQSVVWNAIGSSGLYFYRLDAFSEVMGELVFSDSKAMLLVK